MRKKFYNKLKKEAIEYQKATRITNKPRRLKVRVKLFETPIQKLKRTLKNL